MGLKRLYNACKNADDLARDLLWRRDPELASTAAPSWSLPPREPDDLVIEWPATYQWGEALAWFRHLLRAIGTHARVVRVDLPQDGYEGAVVARFLLGGRAHRVAIDYSDHMERINRAALDGSVLYFKMQHRRGGYGDERIRPGGYPVSSPHLYRYLPRLRQLAGRPRRFEVSGRFGLRYSAGVRRAAIALLDGAGDFSFEGGTSFVRHGRYLRDLARSKIGIDLPGQGDFCFRLVDQLAIGVCTVGPRPRTEMHVPLIDRLHVVHCADDLSDLLPLCRRYLEDDTARGGVESQARDYFDRYLHRDQMARYYLHTFFNAVQA